jgi:hypothetical protein
MADILEKKYLEDTEGDERVTVNWIVRMGGRWNRTGTVPTDECCYSSDAECCSPMCNIKYSL